VNTDWAPGSIVFVTQKPGHVVVSFGEGIFRSTDGGESWKKIGNAGNDGVAAHPGSATTFFSFGVREGAFRSTDDGATWTKMKNHGLPLGSVAIRLLPPNANGSRLYLAVDTKGIGVSLDGGDAWTIGTGMPTGAGSDVSAIAPHPTQADVAFADTVAQGL